MPALRAGVTVLVVAGLLAGCARGAFAPASVPAANVTERPEPPADLDARLLEHYPLRGFVLKESGFARVRFEVSATGNVRVSAIETASKTAYAHACWRMLEQSVWKPARDDKGQAVPFTAMFDCVFEHPQHAAPRTSRSGVVTPPVPPSYGTKWYEQFSDDDLARDSGAELAIYVQHDGAVRVLGATPGSHPAVIEACRRLLEEGPRWQPARDAANAPTACETTFTCKVELVSRQKELALGNVGAAGPLPVETIAGGLTQHLHAFSHCFESAASLNKAIHGSHWLVFQILPSGSVGKVEWVERPLEDELLESCVFSVARELRFEPAAASTLADIQLQVGGLARAENTL
jgi:hypothetical protein